MTALTAYGWAGGALLIVSTLGWVFSLRHNDVSIVDSLWSLMFLVVAAVYFVLADGAGPRGLIVLTLVTLWALRLSIYITRRNHGKGEDYRYQEIRERNEPGFRHKSLYLVFWLQAGLAWIISLPLLSAAGSQSPLGTLDYAGILLWLVGFLFEAIGDYQLSQFKKEPTNRGRVLDTGLWRYSRHPNYFGNFTLWWGFYLIALSAGGWWTIVSPLLMAFLLLRVSGVVLLEKDIKDRRPAYADYVRTTNAFFPGPKRAAERVGA